ncbi:MAG: hypothetical protein LBI33_00830 [Propionibacteriaceae bacterium]|jgi:hypothetical protein|nr:hypothetical protein [Propionibacteriaceae bacterium]
MKGLRGVVVVVVLGVGLVGCAPGGEVTSSPSTGESTTVVVTPTPSPTPQWTAEEQGAVDAVREYMRVWDDIAQNLGTADINRIHEVAGDPLASDEVVTLSQWESKGLRLVGSPTFRVDHVERGVQDYQGTIYRVGGCYSVNANLVDEAGGVIGGSRKEPGTVVFTVLHLTTGRYMVTDNAGKDVLC